ncbi:MAG: alpha/beta fold hydrolase [Bryobacterales bacterium]|nr:alpha/beta fold hydrolase [Bryobacterales bacterium]
MCARALFPFAFAAALLPAADSLSIAEAVFDELVRQDFPALAARFSAQMKAAAPPEKLAATVAPALTGFGPLRSGRPRPRYTQAQGNDVFVFPAEFEKNRVNIIITLNPEGQLAGMFFQAPDPEPPKAGELLVATGDARLPATLALPDGPGPFPVLVLVHGSGPQDRDETIGANAPFRDLADGLASRGVGTLRYVKRTRQAPQSPVPTVEQEVIEDALSAMALARRQARVDPKKVFLLGHSLGGYLGPRIALRDSEVAGLVLLAANARPIETLAREQLRYLGAPSGTLDKLLAAAPASYWADLRAYEPVATAQKVRAPMLILQGERDYQVTMEDFGLWKEGLQSRADVILKSYPKLNHLFLEGEGKSVPAEYGKPGRIPDYVLDDVAAFVKSAAKPR